MNFLPLENDQAVCRHSKRDSHYITDLGEVYCVLCRPHLYSQCNGPGCFLWFSVAYLNSGRYCPECAAKYQFDQDLRRREVAAAFWKVTGFLIAFFVYLIWLLFREAR
jgi:hypothetical protein